MSTEIIIALIGVFSTIVSSWTTWFLTRKKYNSEVENENIQNMQESLEFYVKLADDYKQRLTAEIDSHNNEVAELKKENAELKREIREQEKKFDERLLAQQREITMMKNQMLSVYSQVCLNFKCLERTAATNIPDNTLKIEKKSNSSKIVDK